MKGGLLVLADDHKMNLNAWLSYHSRGNEVDFIGGPSGPVRCHECFFQCNPDWSISMKDHPWFGFLGIDGNKLIMTQDHGKVKCWFNGNKE